MEPDEIAALEKKKRELADAMGESASAAESADTTINVNNHAAPRPAPFRPTIKSTTPQPSPAASPALAPPTISADTPRYGSETLADVSAPRGTHTETRTTINWGKVAKGALIVGAAVLVVAVVAPWLATAVMTNPTTGAFVTNTITTVTPYLHIAEGWAVTGMQIASNAAADLWALAGSGLTSLSGTLGITSAAAAATTAPTAAVVAMTPSVISASTAVAAGGAGAVLLGGALTHPGSFNLFDTHTITVPDVATPAGSSFTPAHPAPQPQADASLDTSSTAGATLANKSIMASSHAHGLEEAAHAGHHAGEVTHEHARDRAHAREVLQRSAHASKAWADRVGGAGEPIGAFSDRFTPKSATAIQPRNDSYAEQLNLDPAATLQPAR